MTTDKKTATFIRSIEDWTGDARLYHLSAPLVAHSWDDDEPEQRYEYVIVSATVAMLTGPETYIFGCNENGDGVNWTELEGSYRGALNHARALAGAGYEAP